MQINAIRSATLLALIFLFPQAMVYAQYSIHPLLETGPQEERITILLMSEGYTEQELPQFTEDAQKVMGDFFSASPFSEYKDYFNVYAIKVASNESGADHPAQDIYRDTYFHVQYVGSNIIFGAGGRSRFDSIRAELGMDWWNSISMVLVNDDTPLGTPYITARGYYFDEFGSAVHEIGHQFGYLIDEYIAPDFTPVYEGRNVTRETRREHVKWRHWFEEDTPIPTPFTEAYFDRVGLFEGGGYAENDVFRPQIICKMNYSGDPFCAVCREHLIGEMHSAYNMKRMRITSPAEDSLIVQGFATMTFNLRTPKPTHGLRTTWRVNGIAVSEDTERFELETAGLGTGIHTVELVIADETPMVRDPYILPHLTTTRKWILLNDTAQEISMEVETNGVDLAPNFPNPVAMSTMFSFRLTQVSPVRLTIYDMLGREVAKIVDGFLHQGQHRVVWQPNNVASGVYLYVLETPGLKITRRMIIVH